jgi:predicted Fe-S protein YdhL (DUF1289 family)
MQTQSPTWPEGDAGKLSNAQCARWTQELASWQKLPEAQRAELCAQFRRFFYATGDQQKETIRAMSAAERLQMEQALQAYDNLPPGLRRQCVESFSKFAAMTPEEQNQFLQNAEKWDSMTPSERQLWRKLVNELPPSPPGFNRALMPPMPPGWPGFPSHNWGSGPGATKLAETTNR